MLLSKKELEMNQNATDDDDNACELTHRCNAYSEQMATLISTNNDFFRSYILDFFPNA